jgi:lipopolysaccharide export system protein LptA
MSREPNTAQRLELQYTKKRMPPKISSLRRWFAMGAVAVVLMVSGAYFYARHRVTNALKEVPGKIGLEIQQSAQGFTISKSEQGHTLFKIQASKAIQYREGGRAELHDVAITLYGSDSSRYDQIYGATFDYDPDSGDVISRGEVQIDLQANPEGIAHPDQTAPKELKNPIHLKTTNLIFNQKTGDAHTDDKVEFRIPQANGSALGVHYTSKTGVLDLHSQIRVAFTGATAASLTAGHGTITKDPRVVVLDGARLANATDTSEAEVARFYLRPDNTLDHVVATGNVQIATAGKQVTHTRADQIELLMTEDARDPMLRTAVLTGSVHSEMLSDQPMQGDAGKAVVDFTGKNVVSKVHALENVKLLQRQHGQSAGGQDVELTSTAMDFLLADGRRLRRAETLAPGQFTMRPVENSAGQETVVTAGKFEAKSDDLGQLASAHGAPDARIVNRAPGQPDRVSTSEMLDLTFRPGSGIETITQQGNVVYVDQDRKAWGERARYTTADQMLVLTGSPRIEQGGMTTTARTMRMNRATGEALAEGEVKSTYSDLKPQPGGALLASSDPIHVTSQNMTAQRSPAIAVYAGDARLWQNGNVVEAPSIEFDRDQRSVIAHDSVAQRVSTVMVEADKSGKVTPAVITSGKLTYKDDERRAHFEGGVIAKSQDATITCHVMDVFLKPREQNPSPVGSTASPRVAGAEKLDRIVATGQVIITQPARRGTGDQLVYTAEDDKYVLTGGPPSIFDAERGKITGVSLTFFRTDDRVLVEGNEADPAVTHTRVAR